MPEDYPTSASIKLAEEFIEKAKQSVVKSFSLDVDNNVKGTVVITNEAMGHFYSVCVRFVLNGKEYTNVKKMSSDKFRTYDKTDAIKNLRKEMGEAIQEALDPNFVQAVDISLRRNT